MEGKKFIILEAVANGGLHIFYAFLRFPRSYNDLNVLDQSPLVHNIFISKARDMQFVINECEYDQYYLLTNIIYLEWVCFVQSIHLPLDEKKAHFAKRQEAARKDVDYCFGVLQAGRPILILATNQKISPNFV
jgi:hypothetical protein